MDQGPLFAAGWREVTARARQDGGKATASGEHFSKQPTGNCRAAPLPHAICVPVWGKGEGRGQGVVGARWVKQT